MTMPVMNFKQEAAAPLPYTYFESEAKGDRHPLVVFLHGVGERGKDNMAPLNYRFFSNPTSLFGAKTNFKHPAHILVPQCPLDDQWIDVANWSDQVKAAAEPTKALAAVWDLINAFRLKPTVDPQRIYLTGLSMGAFGAIDLAARHPRTFAAVVAVCGGGDPAQASALLGTPLYLFHGAQDSVVPVAQARALMTALIKVGGTPYYREYPDIGHLAWDLAFRDQMMISWLFRQALPAA